MGNEDLGNHFLAMGDFVTAAKCYTRMREYCTTQKHIQELQLKLLHLSLLQGAWTNAQSFRVKMFTSSSGSDEKALSQEAIMNACIGLSHLCLRQYRDAANSFLDVDPIYMTTQPQANINFRRQQLSPNDIAIYGGLCALAVMDSAELKSRILENQKFRQFLELEPHLRRAINMFCSGKFSSCLGVLDSYAADYKIDLYLRNTFDEIYMEVRAKSLVKWFSAFSVATLHQVQAAFPRLGNCSIEEELETMIKGGILDARIDLVDGVSSVTDMLILINAISY
jgi:COP9 signalosome complex subunit 1